MIVENKQVIERQAFHLGEHKILPEQLLVITDGQSFQIDSKIMSLLVFFAKNAGQVVSRDTLIEHVWHGTVVSESSINWAISQLRKTLGDSAVAPKYLKTIPKRGYQLIAKVQLTDKCEQDGQDELTPAPPMAIKSPASPMLKGLILVCVLIAGYLLTRPQENSQKYRMESAKLITSLKGREESGRLSPDGKQLLFRHKSGLNSHWQLYVQAVSDNKRYAEYDDEGKQTGRLLTSNRPLSAVPLLSDTHSYLAAEWSPDGSNIAVVRYTPTTKQCSIVLLRLDTRLSVIQQQPLTPCSNRGWSKLAWHPKEDTLFFTDHRQPSSNYQAFKLDIASGTVAAISSPDVIGLGDSFITIDHSGTKLLLLRDENEVKTHFMSLELNDNSLEELAVVDSRYYTAYWGASDDIWLNWGNNKVLSFNPQSQQSQQLFASTLDWNYDTKPYPELSLALFTSSSANRQDLVIFEQQNRWQPESITSSFNESLPTINKQGELAYISDRGGIPQIWLDTDEQLQLTDLNQYAEFESLQWSNSNQRILATRKGFLASIHIGKESMDSHYQGDLHPRHAVWSSNDQSILFTAKNNNKWSLYQVPAQSSIQSPKMISDSGIYTVKAYSQDKLLYTKYGKQGLWSLELSTSNHQLLLPDFPWRDAWQVSGDVVTYMMRIESQSVFKQYNLNTNKVSTLTSVANGIKLPFTVSHDNNKIIAVAYVAEESAIYQIPFTLNN